MRDASTKKVPERLFVPSDELRFGWHKTFANLKVWLWIGAIGAFLSMLQNALSRPADGLSMRPLLVLCIQALQVALMLAAFRLALRIAEDRPYDDLDPKALLAGYFPFLLTHILFWLIVGGGLLLLIVPGVIWGLAFCFAPLLCAAEGYDPVESLRESRRLTLGHRRTLFVFGLLCLGVNLLGALALGIGLFVTVPTTIIAFAHVLRTLQAHSPHSLVKRGPSDTALVPGPHAPTT